MTAAQWTLLHGLVAVVWLWILCWGGAKWLEGWRAFIFIDWFAARWNAEQLRLYALCSLVVQGAWYVLGLLYPEFRG